ncbi:hypothetical protein MTO96_000319 [Rhipicephalus appendiculatus]
MNRTALCAALLILGMASVNEAIRCRLPQIGAGEWVLGIDGKECVSVVKQLCDNMANNSTHAWRRGAHVRSDCDGARRIESLTAIATFLAANNGYQGHAAIFDSCDSDGIWVYDQWNKTDKYFDRRKIEYGNIRTPSLDGDNFYVIELP